MSRNYTVSEHSYISFQFISRHACARVRLGRNSAVTEFQATDTRSDDEDDGESDEDERPKDD